MTAGTVVLLVVCTAFYYVDDWLEGKISSIMAEKVTEPNLLTCQSLKVSVLKGMLTLNNVSAKLILNKDNREIAVEVPEIRVKGINWPLLIGAKKLIISSVEIDQPKFFIGDFKGEHPAREDKTSEVNRLKALQVNEAVIRDGEFRTAIPTEKGMMQMAADSINFELHEILYTNNNREQPLDIQQASLSFQNFSQYNEHGFHKISCRQFHLSSEDSLIEISHLNLTPRFTTEAFFDDLTYKKSKLSLEFPDVKIAGWRFSSVLQKHIEAQKVSIDDMKIAVLSDKLLAVDPTAYKPLPQELLLQAPFTLTLDTVEVKDSWLKYENLGMDRNKPGRLEFSRLEAQFNNVTNDTARIRQQPLLSITATANLQEKHFVEQQFWMDLSHPDYAFSYAGSTSDVLFTDLNDFLSPTNRIAFEAGTIVRMNYSVNADKNVANGELELEYTGLDFSFLNKHQEKKKLLSEIVDLFFIDKDNLKSDNNFKMGEVHTERNVHQSFFNFWWEGIQSGIRSSVLTDKNMERIQKYLSKRGKH